MANASTETRDLYGIVDMGRYTNPSTHIPLPTITTTKLYIENT